MWLLYLVGSYILVWIVPVISGLRVGTISKIIGPPFTLPVILVFHYDFPRSVDIWLIVLQVFLYIILLFIYKTENELIQEEKDNSASAIMNSINNYNETEPFALYLRPFDTTNQLTTQINETGFGGSGQHIDLETVLERALKPEFALISFGRPGEMLGAGRIKLPESAWFRKFKLLANKAHIILIVPSVHKGTFREMEYLTRNKLLRKCAFIMPETLSGESDTFRKNWNAAINSVMDLGLNLPPYCDYGAIFKITDDGSFENFIPLNMNPSFSRVRKIRKALKNLMDT